MKTLLYCASMLTFLFNLCSLWVSGQFRATLQSKAALDTGAVKQWVTTGRNSEVSISNDGKFVSYIILNQPHQSHSLVVQSTENFNKLQFTDAKAAYFSRDSKKCIFVKGDTLFILSLTGKRLDDKYVANLLSWSRPISRRPSFPVRNDEWLAWKQKSSPQELTVLNLITAKEFHFSSVIDYMFGERGKILLIKTNSNAGDTKSTELKRVNLSTGDTKTIWCSNETSSLLSYVADTSENQVALVIKDSAFGSMSDQPHISLWYYKEGMLSAQKKIDNNSDGLEQNLCVVGIPRFSDNGKYIFFYLGEKMTRKRTAEYIKLDIWSYKDTLLQSRQLLNLAPKRYLAVVGIDSSRLIQITHDFEESASTESGDFLVISKNTWGDRFWVRKPDNYKLFCLRDGSQVPLETEGQCSFWFSPQGKYLVYYDGGESRKNYYSYNLITKELRTIGGGKPAFFEWSIGYSRPDPNAKWTSLIVGKAGWLASDRGLLVYDDYDVWQLDLSGQKLPLNVTKGYGKSRHIKLRLAFERNLPYNNNDSVLLTAYDPVTKENGFYKTCITCQSDPQELTFGRYVWSLYGECLYTGASLDFDKGMQPVKAKDAQVWILKRQSIQDEPNYFVTNDFKSFKPLTEFKSHKSFNWLTAELVSFRQLDGKISQGVLYKPENFNHSEKYPVLMNYYEQLSHRLNQFPTIGFMEHNISVAWFVSRGYLVFTPDIHFVPGKPGNSAYNAIEGARKFLSSLEYVDSSKIGINGHSVGGGFTNYIITHSSHFAAAIEGAGVSDKISAAFWVSQDGTDRVSLTEKNVGGKPLWDSPDQWLAESPIMNVKKITTPLIIFHSKSDGAVPWEQGVELFLAMRRLGKKVWMLQYDEGNHGVAGKDAQDYTIRATQFFDHYLKNAPAPKWMLEGIPAKMKGIDDGLELVKEKDNNGKWKTPQEGGLLTDEEKKKVDALKRRKPITIKLD